jgi:hypothetical protein
VTFTHYLPVSCTQVDSVTFSLDSAGLVSRACASTVMCISRYSRVFGGLYVGGESQSLDRKRDRQVNIKVT